MNTFERISLKTGLPLIGIAVLLFSVGLWVTAPRAKREKASRVLVNVPAQDAGTCSGDIDGDGIPDDVDPQPEAANFPDTKKQIAFKKEGTDPAFVLYIGAVTGLVGALSVLVAAVSRLIRAITALRYRKGK